MTDKKNIKKIKEKKYKSEDQQEIIRFIKILVVLVIFILAIYFLTRIFVKQDLLNQKEETPVTEISYSKMIFGTMLNRPYEEYYVLAFSSEDNNANYYSTIADKYSSEEDSLYIYYIDLEDSVNKEFVSEDEKTNPNATTINDLKVGDLTLFKIKDGKIVKYIEKIEDIKSELGIK